MAGLPLPPLNLNSNATSRAGDIFREGNGDDLSGFTVNYGSGSSNASNSKTADMPFWAWIAVGAGVVLLIKRKG